VARGLPQMRDRQAELYRTHLIGRVVTKNLSF